jgi:hypothetical protein
MTRRRRYRYVTTAEKGQDDEDASLTSLGRLDRS